MVLAEASYSGTGFPGKNLGAISVEFIKPN